MIPSVLAVASTCPAHPWAQPPADRWLSHDAPRVPAAGAAHGAANIFLCHCVLVGFGIGHSLLFLLSTSGLN